MRRCIKRWATENREASPRHLPGGGAREERQRAREMHVVLALVRSEWQRFASGTPEGCNTCLLPAQVPAGIALEAARAAFARASLALVSYRPLAV